MNVELFGGNYGLHITYVGNTPGNILMLATFLFFVGNRGTLE
jgi:hypothetical protein